MLVSVNKHVYLDLVQQHLPPVITAIKQECGDATYMQDNARPHVANIVKDWFIENDITVMECPPYSPDLNPIEQVWKRLKEHLQKKHPNLAKMPGGPEKVKKKLVELLPEAWEAVESSFLLKLVESMPRRVEAVIAARGWYTKY